MWNVLKKLEADYLKSCEECPISLFLFCVCDAPMNTPISTWPFLVRARLKEIFTWHYLINVEFI
jgi:hypothetical protein